MQGDNIYLMALNAICDVHHVHANTLYNLIVITPLINTNLILKFKFQIIPIVSLY